MAVSIDDDIRVIYVIGGRRIGGMEIHLVTLARRLPASIRCLVCCLDASAEYRALLTEAGIEHANLDCPMLVRPRSVLAFRRFRHVVKGFRPHIVHSYGFSGDVIAAALRASGVNVRVITSRRSEDRHAGHQATRRLVNRVSDRIVCVSAETANFVMLTEWPPACLLEVIPNGVAPHPAEVPARARDRREPIRFGALGTVKPVKGTDLLIEAFMQFTPAHRVELVIAGLIDRPWAEALRDRAATDPRVRFIGRSSAPREFLSGLDVFVLPSRSEGMSNALLEAMTAALPCIATDVGSNRSLLCPPGESPAGVIAEPAADSLFQAMRTMAACPDARARYGAQGAAIARTRHTIRDMVSDYERLYRSVVGRPVSHPSIVVPTCATE